MKCKGFHRSQKPDQGAVLLVVLWIVLVMGLLGMSFSAAIRTEVNSTRNVVEQKKSFYLARAGIEYGVYRILESQSAFTSTQQLSEGNIDQIPEVLTGKLSLVFPDAKATIEVADESGKINLNSPASQMKSDLIYNLLIVLGIEPANADIITDSIADWIDPDELENAYGAESNYYLSLSPPYLSANSIFQVPEELLLVRGVTPEIYYGKKGLSESGEKVDYYGLQHYFTTFSEGNRINANSAPFPVLAALPYLDEEIATRIFELRKDSYIQDPNQLMRSIPGLTSNVANLLVTNAKASVYGLTSRGQLQGSKVVSKIRCVIELDQRASGGYRILYWNEASTEI